MLRSVCIGCNQYRPQATYVNVGCSRRRSADLPFMSDFVSGTDAGEEDSRPVTIYDIQSAEDTKVRVRALPRLTRQALRLARQLRRESS
jgi:hypothetical protein